MILEYISSDFSSGKSVFALLGIIMFAYIIAAGTEIKEADKKCPINPDP